MRFPKLFLPLLLVLGSLSTVQGAVTIAFNGPFSGGMSSNLADRNGVVSNGLKWGIIVDTTSNGLLVNYDRVVLTQGMSVTLTANGGTVTGDRLILANDLTSDSSQGGQLLEGDSVTPGGDGGVTGISFALSGGVTAGQKFWIVWFDESSYWIKAGSLSASEFVVPAESQTVTLSQVFVGVDPVRTADNYIFGFPEPSTLMLGLLGGLSLLRRCRD